MSCHNALRMSTRRTLPPAILMLFPTLVACQPGCDRQTVDAPLDPKVVAAQQQREQAEKRQLDYSKAVETLRDQLHRTELALGSARAADELRPQVDELVIAYENTSESWHENVDNKALLQAAEAVKAFREVLNLWDLSATPSAPPIDPRRSDALEVAAQQLKNAEAQRRVLMKRWDMTELALSKSKEAREALRKGAGK